MCVLLIIKWNNLIFGVFSSNFTSFLKCATFGGSRIFSIISIISTSYICHTCHICYLREINFCLRQTVNCGPLTWSKLFLTLAMNLIWRRLQTFCCTQTKDRQQLQWHCWIILLIPLAEEIFLRSAYKLLRKMSIGGWQKKPSSEFHGQQ